MQQYLLAFGIHPLFRTANMLQARCDADSQGTCTSIVVAISYLEHALPETMSNKKKLKYGKVKENQNIFFLKQSFPTLVILMPEITVCRRAMARTDDREQCRPRSSRISSSNGSTTVAGRELFFYVLFFFLKSNFTSQLMADAEEGKGKVRK